MFDMFNVNVGGGNHPRSTKHGNVSVSQQVSRVALPPAPTTDNVKFAKRIARLFDTSGMDYYGVASALWDHAGDGVLRHLYSLADALLDVAAHKHSANLDYTLVQKQAGGYAKALQNHLDRTGFKRGDEDVDDTLDYLEGLTPRN